MATRCLSSSSVMQPCNGNLLRTKKCCHLLAVTNDLLLKAVTWLSWQVVQWKGHTLTPSLTCPSTTSRVGGLRCLCPRRASSRAGSPSSRIPRVTSQRQWACQQHTLLGTLTAGHWSPSSSSRLLTRKMQSSSSSTKVTGSTSAVR